MCHICHDTSFSEMEKGTDLELEKRQERYFFFHGDSSKGQKSHQKCVMYHDKMKEFCLSTIHQNVSNNIHLPLYFVVNIGSLPKTQNKFK